MQFSAQLDVQVVAIEASDEVSVMLDLASPPARREAERAAATLQVVLDRSGSMEGAALDGAIEALCRLVSRLDSRDNFGVVVFDDEADVVVPAGPLTDKAGTIARLRRIRAEGMTDLSGGYLRGLQELKRVAAGGGGTLLLVSDGHANQGIRDPFKLERLAASAGKGHIVTSTLGYGPGYDESALSGMARGGSGNHHFAADPDQAGAAIASEATELLDKSVQAASLLVSTSPEVALLQLYNDLPSQQLPDGRVMVELGDFYADERRRLLLRFAVPALAALGPVEIASFEVRYVELPDLVEQAVTIPVQVNVVPGDEAARREADPTVETEKLFQEAQQAKRRASEALEHGRRDQAAGYFAEADSKLTQAIRSAAAELQDDVRHEQREVSKLRDRASWDDTNLMSKHSRASFHQSSRKRRRPSPGPTGESGKL